MTQDTQHTPGPWFYDWSSKTNGVVNQFHIGPQIGPLDEMGNVEPLITVDNDSDEAEANARLIAAAPELLEALAEVEIFIANMPKGIGRGAAAPVYNKIEAAISKAKGGAE